MTKMGREPKTDMLAEFERAPLLVPCREMDENKKSEAKGKNNMKITQFNSCRLSGWILRERIAGEDEVRELETDGERYGRNEGEEADGKDKETKRTDKDIPNEKPACSSTGRKPADIPLRRLRLHWWDESTEREDHPDSGSEGIAQDTY